MVTSVQGIRGLWSYVGLCTLWITIPQVALRHFSQHTVTWLSLWFASSSSASSQASSAHAAEQLPVGKDRDQNKHRWSFQGTSRSFQNLTTKHWVHILPGAFMCFRKKQQIPWQLSALQQIQIKVATATIPTGSPGDLLGGICQQPVAMWASPSPPAAAVSRDPLRSWFAPSPPASSPPGGTGQPPVSARESAWGSSLPPEPCSCQLFVYPSHRQKQMQFVPISPQAGCRISISYRRKIRTQW